MATSYTICLVETFLNKKEFRAGTQLTLPDTEEHPESYYKLEDENFIYLEKNGEPLVVSKYNAYQDLVQNKHGKAFGRFFHWYLEPREFPIYHIPTLNIMLFGTGKQTVEVFLSQMKEDPESGFKCSKLEVDFCKLQPLLPMVSGAWFAELQKKKQYLKSAALFGPHVDKSEEFRAAAEAGVISLLFFPYSYFGKDLQLGVTKNGSIIFYNRIKNPVTKDVNIAAEISLVIELYRKFLDPNK